MIKDKNIGAIIFDLGGVILNIDYQLTIDAFEKLGIKNFDSIFSQFKQASLSDDFETGKISENEFYEELKRISKTEFSFEAYKNAWNAMLLNLPRNRIEFLKILSTKYRLFLFSNTNQTHYEEFNKKTEGDFDEIFEQTYYSHTFGRRKPDKDSFMKILSENNLKQENTLFVDDSIQHIQSANELGITALHITSLDVVTELKGWI